MSGYDPRATTSFSSETTYANKTSPYFVPSGGTAVFNNNVTVGGTFTQGVVGGTSTVIGEDGSGNGFVATYTSADGQGYAYHDLFTATSTPAQRFRREIDPAGNCLMFHQDTGSVTKQVMEWNAAGTAMDFAFITPTAGTGLTVKASGITTPAVISAAAQVPIPDTSTTTIVTIDAANFNNNRPFVIQLNMLFFPGDLAGTVYNVGYTVNVCDFGGNIIGYVENQAIADTALPPNWSIAFNSSGSPTATIDVTSTTIGTGNVFCNYNYTIIGAQ